MTHCKKQLAHEHNSALKSEVKKDLATYRADLVKEQTARKDLESAITTYDTTVKQDKGYDHGTIVKTTPAAEKILNSVKKTLETDQSLIQHDIQQTKNDITKAHLQSAVNDAKKGLPRCSVNSSF
ncbi:hypothetical protein GCM10025859_59370 [Alicyclobacillus fastidiosus]|nr:hypothetical protein GCM10025859_00100 [Alicyclobacillus fastidiosus]GMA65497.1 hypothetical protein GCM10025859_59370 [Alicyclobacillus fastidiosus]